MHYVSKVKSKDYGIWWFVINGHQSFKRDFSQKRMFCILAGSLHWMNSIATCMEAQNF